MEGLDIAIAGCGIAGLSAAVLLARQGHAVTIYERFDEPRPLGSGLMLQPTGMAVLDRLGLAARIVREGAPVAGLLGLNTEGEPVLEADYAELPIADAFGLGIHRASLFGALYDAAIAAGIRLETGFAVARFTQTDGAAVLIDTAGRRSPPHDLVIDALGVGSSLVPPRDALLPYGALWATLDWPCNHDFDPRWLEQRYERALRMVGLLPVAPGRAAFFWSLRADEYDHWREAGMDAWWAQVCRLWPACESLRQQLTEPGQLVFARYAHRTSPPSPHSRLVHIGDAWHAASPQLGQGANMALLDAWALARALEETSHLAAMARQYRAMRLTHVRLYQWLTWAFTPPFQSDAAWPAILRDLLLAPASRIAPGPRLKAHLVAGLAGNPFGPLGLTMPDYCALAEASRTASRASALPQS